MLFLLLIVVSREYFIEEQELRDPEAIEKVYLDSNVYDEAIRRIDFILDEFEEVCVSFSGGKDSSVLLQLVLSRARLKGRLPIKVMFIDFEAQYAATIRHVEEMLVGNPDIIAYWICLPFKLRNAVSVYDPHWICWDERKRDLWVREYPEYDCVITRHNLPVEWTWFFEGMEFEEFVVPFAMWLRDTGGVIGDRMELSNTLDKKVEQVSVDGLFADTYSMKEIVRHSTDRQRLTCNLVAIRADESLNRFRALRRVKDDTKYKGLNWTTKMRHKVYNAYPIYDWKTEDIWTAVGRFGLKYNKIYDFMYMAGTSIHESRLCQPFGDDQRQGLDLFRKIEPETWFRLVQRVAGANFGNIYVKSPILGHGKVFKPDHMTWREYTNFLLNTIPKYQAHIYKERIEQFLDWWEQNGDWPREEVPDATPPKTDPRWYKPDGTMHRKVPSWERIAKAILKNDITCKSLSFGCVIGGYPRYLKLKEMYGE
ncbi:MAG: DUF3440 domain-containing protein [Methanobacteriota archaeon]|nr:MAG: DUF3440 domain-containing protein [Euryarchaeota archaeon]